MGKRRLEVRPMPICNRSEFGEYTCVRITDTYSRSEAVAHRDTCTERENLRTINIAIQRVDA